MLWTGFVKFELAPVRKVLIRKNFASDSNLVGETKLLGDEFSTDYIILKLEFYTSFCYLFIYFYLFISFVNLIDWKIRIYSTKISTTV